MTDYTQFTANVASTVPASEEVVYNKYWLTNLRVMARNPSQPVKLSAEFKAARDIQVEANVNGEITTIDTKELMPDAESKRVMIADVLNMGDGDAEFATAINTVFDKLKTLGIEKGIFSA